MRAIDRIAGQNRLAGASVVEKASFSLGLLLLAAVLPPWPTSAAAFAIVQLALWGFARVKPKDYLQVVAAPLFFLAISLLPLIVSLDTSGTGVLRLSVTPHGLRLAGEVALRVLACLHCLIFLTLTTPLSQLLDLMRRSRVPTTIVEISLLVYRYIWVLLDAFESIYRAQTARLGYSSFRSSYRSAAHLAVCLLGQAVHRAKQLEHGLEARNWQGELRVLDASVSHSPLRLGAIFSLLVAILGGTLACHLA